jgi:hypothetical protein
MDTCTNNQPVGRNPFEGRILKDDYCFWHSGILKIVLPSVDSRNISSHWISRFIWTE